MKRYLVALHGQNLLIHFRGELAKCGFYTRRYVDAANQDHAERIALGLIINDSSLQRLIQNRETDPPSIAVEEVREAAGTPEYDQVETQYTYYKETPGREV